MKISVGPWTLSLTPVPHIFLGGLWLSWSQFWEIYPYVNGDRVEVDGWTFDLLYGALYFRERSDTWAKFYLPPGGVRGLNVLDLGAGQGESAKFYLDNGAREVLCVERDDDNLEMLRDNSKYGKLRIVGYDFTIKQLEIPEVDVIKCDIEGFEFFLAKYLEGHRDYNKEIIVEVHSVFHKELFEALGFKFLGGATAVGLNLKYAFMYRPRRSP